MQSCAKTREIVVMLRGNKVMPTNKTLVSSDRDVPANPKHSEGAN